MYKLLLLLPDSVLLVLPHNKHSFKFCSILYVYVYIKHFAFQFSDKLFATTSSSNAEPPATSFLFILPFYKNHLSSYFCFEIFGTTRVMKVTAGAIELRLEASNPNI